MECGSSFWPDRCQKALDDFTYTKCNYIEWQNLEIKKDWTKKNTQNDDCLT